MTRPRQPDPLAYPSGWTELTPSRSRTALVCWSVAVGASLAWLVVMLAAPMRLGCPQMWSPSACAAGSTGAVAAVLIAAAVGVRAGWLGLTASRAVRALPQRPIPPALARAAGCSGTTRVSCVDAAEPVAFCAGLWRPRVYVSVGTVVGLAGDELAAVLAHENAHARRRDPLRGLLVRACADVAFFAPLLRWWHLRRHLAAELAADRAAVEHAGAPAVAGALLRLAGRCPAAPGGAAAFGPTAAVLEARIAALTAATASRKPLPLRLAMTSMAGVLATGVVVTCLPALVIMPG